jgi:hypothetical protein
VPSIIIDPTKEDRPIFKSTGVYKHLRERWMCYLVELPGDTFNPDQYKGECIIDGKRRHVVSVERADHTPPWRKGELVALAVVV